MKKPILLIFCILLLTACGRGLEAADIEGSWENAAATLYFGDDGTYEIKYADPKPGELSSESGEFELDGGKIELRLRDKYTVDEFGDVDFERFGYTENRKVKIGLDGDVLTLDGEEYGRRQTD